MQNIQKPNPLTSLMRQPKIYIKLPSQGRYWTEGSIDLSENGEYAVYSMTAKDELMLKTPDALLNGQAVVSVIESCIPNIKDAWQTPSIDLDTILIAIRMATYGDSMETSISVAGQDATYTVDLRSLIDQLTSTITWIEQVTINNDIVVYLRPLAYKEVSRASVETFETQRILNLVNDNTIDEDRKLELFKDSFNKLTQVTLGVVTDSIYKIDSVAGVVTEKEYIKEFMDNCDKEVFNTIKNHLDKLQELNTLKPMKVRATEEMIAAGSAEEIEVPIVFDASNFFG